jgi:metal-dependent amidase/aminoacylase/carboxypeptidase family protein
VAIITAQQFRIRHTGKEAHASAYPELGINAADAVGAENLIRAGQAAWWYSWRIPPSRSRRRMMR